MLWSAIVHTETVKMPFSIYRATASHQIVFRPVRIAYHRIPFDAITIGGEIIGKFVVCLFFVLAYCEFAWNGFKLTLPIRVLFRFAFDLQISFPIETVQSGSQGARQQRFGLFGTVAWFLYKESTARHSRNERPTMQ